MSVWSDGSSVFKAFIGSNYLGVPYAFRLVGLWLGIPVLILISIVTRMGCRMVITCKEELEKNGKLLFQKTDIDHVKDENTPLEGVTTSDNVIRHRKYSGNTGIHLHVDGLVNTVVSGSDSIDRKQNENDLTEGLLNESSTDHSGYAMIGLQIFGIEMQRAIKLCLVVTQFGYCVGYVIFMSSTLRDLDFFSSLNVPFSVLAFFPFCLGLSFLKDLTVLAPINAFANFSLLIGLVAVIVSESMHINEFGISNRVEIDFSNLPIFFGMMCGAMEGIGLVIPLETSITMRHSRLSFLYMLDIAIFGVTAILVGFGALGVFTYGYSLMDVIIGNLPNTIPLKCVRVSLILGILGTYPMQLFPVVEIVGGYFSSKKCFVPYVVRFCVVSATIVVAVALPSFHVISSFTGCLGGVLLSFIFPALFSMKLFAPFKFSRKFSFYWWQNIVMILFGVIGGVTGIIVNIKNLS